MRFGITSLRSLIVTLAVVVVIALTPQAAAAPTLYGTADAGADTESTLYRIHPLTGAATAVGAIGFDNVVIDFHPNGTLYGVGKRRGPSVWVLLEIDQATGLGTEIGTLNNTLQTTGGGYYDVSFRKDGTLFLIAKSQVNPNGLFTVDLATGVATEIGDTLTAGSGNALGFTLIDTLRHADNAAGGTLYTVDQVTGASGGPTAALTYVGFPALSGGEKLNAMDVNPDTGVPFVSVNDGSAGSGPNYLATLDPATGTVTHVALSVNGLDGLAWQPSPCVVTLYGAAKETGQGSQPSTLYRFNVTDATTVAVGPIGFNRVGAMDFHPVNGLLYATAERPADRTAVLIRINPVTGQGHEVGPLVNTKHQGGHFDLSFRHSDHTLFLMAFDPASTDVNCIVNLFTVDVDTGLATVIGDTMTCDLGNALGFIRDDTLLHLVTEQIGGNPTLYTVDPLTGVSTSTSLLTLLGFPLLVGPPRPNAMDTNPDNGITYVSINDSQSGGAGPNYLGILDPATGNVNNIGSTVVGLDALALRTDCTDYDVCTNDTCLQCEAAGIPCHRSCQLFGAVHDGRDGPSTLYRIDAATGAGTEIGPIGFERVGALDFDASGTLYGIAEIDAGGMNPDIPVLIHVDPITGAGTEVGGLVTTQMGGGHFDLSFRHFDGVLHLMATDSSNAVTVYTVDTATGFAISILGDTTVAGGGNAMAFSPGDALYHASTDLNTFAATLYEVDQFTGISGSPTVLNFLGFAPALAEPRLNSMDYNPCTGVAFTSISNRLVGGGNDNYLATLDPSTGDVTHVGPTVPGLDGLAFYSTEAVCCHVPRTGPVDFMHTVVPRSGTTMDWGGPENVVVVKGDLSALSTYVTTSTTPLPMAMSYTDVAVPAVGTGFYYLVKGDCPVASWSSGGAGECAGPGTPCLPGERDGNLP